MTNEAATPATPQAASNLVPLNEYAPGLVKAAVSAVDVVTKEYNLMELEEHLADIQRLIDTAREGLKDDKKQEILAALSELANEFQFGSVSEMLDAAGLPPTASANGKKSASIEKLGTTKRPPVDKTPKVFTNLLKEEHNGGKIDFKKGHNGILKGKNPGWHYKIDKQPDPAYYRPADDTEIKQMEKIRNEAKRPNV